MDIFDLWNQIKKSLGIKPRVMYVKERDVVFLKLGKNVGHEQDGTGKNFLRPVVVIKKFNNRFFWGVPLTTQQKDNAYYYALISYHKHPGWAILSQGKTFDVMRIQHKIGIVSKVEFIALKKAISSVLDLAS